MGSLGRGSRLPVHAMNNCNYDNWLNSNNPYDLHDEEEREREYHLEAIEGLDEDEVQDYLFANRIDDPREQAVRSRRAVLGGGERHTET